VTAIYRTEHMVRFQFHTGMVQGAILRLMRSELDVACQDKRFAKEFFIDIGFERLPDRKSANVDKFWEGALRDGGSICFIDKTRITEAKAICATNGAKVEKGGYLTKRGHAVKNWKRRWFVMKDPTLCYFKKPNDTSPAGIILLDDILAIISEKNIYKDARPADRPPFWFEIITKKCNYLVAADTEQEMREWVEALEFVSQREVRSVELLSAFNVNDETSIPSSIELYEDHDHMTSLSSAVSAVESSLAALNTNEISNNFEVVKVSPGRSQQDDGLGESQFVMVGNGTSAFKS